MSDRIAKYRPNIRDVISSWEQARPDLDLSNFLLAICVMRLGRIVDDAYDRMCRESYGIRGADMRVLFSLRRAGKPYAKRPTDLFRALVVTSGAITKQVSRLSRAGYVERLDDPSYNGGALIALTAKGLRAADSATERLAEWSLLAPGVARMTGSTKAAGRRFVQELLENLELAATTEGARPPRKSRKSRRSGTLRAQA